MVFGGKSARVKIWPARGIGEPYILKDENIREAIDKGKDYGFGGPSHTF